MIPWVIPRSQSKGHDDRFGRFRTGDCRVSVYFNMGAPFPKNCLFPWEIWTPSNMILWAYPSPQPKGHLNRFCCFCTDDCRVSLYFTMSPLSPRKIVLLHWGIWTPSNARFSGPTQVLNPNGISIGSAIFAGLTSVTDRLTDRLTDHATRSVTIDRIYVCSMSYAV